jgi:uncharacterized membrane protein
MGIQPTDPASFLLLARPNRSLSARGRICWLMLIGASALTLGVAASAIGAWPVLPFAGLEVLLVWFAFRVLGRHDADYEMLQVSGNVFFWELRFGNDLQRLSGNPNWAHVAQSDATGGAVKQLQLTYAGKCVNVGSMMNERQRRELAEIVGRSFRRMGDDCYRGQL